MTNLRKSLFALPMLAALGACQTAYENTADQIGNATLMNAQGATVGTARMYSLGGEVTMNASFSGLTPGVHGVHLHTTGSCVAPAFTSAGGHLNPGGNEHGTQNPRGAHLGDLPNVTIAADGTGTMNAVIRGTLAGVADDLFDADGTAIVVHASADDYRTDPTGNAGDRMACGVVSRS
ncbi:superoxide dismutase family protein [Erythrobacter arachoides]|uniref:Superoxide dismutase [Cu-Zn] n=1 Tax=Aurantiacibacter arachoides TaxID=1850444 RepID=A0A845A4E9_9SPHN|nr:superoxide dismutase family protein [Aurantiacibacter arachoides]MXO94524.1 superoxide dismutase family protein [Aurantiacibacter arachoides]GGD62784.1 superoxide dismutase [Aurantiacibacter arachoides]